MNLLGYPMFTFDQQYNCVYFKYVKKAFKNMKQFSYTIINIFLFTHIHNCLWYALFIVHHVSMTLALHVTHNTFTPTLYTLNHHIMVLLHTSIMVILLEFIQQIVLLQLSSGTATARDSSLEVLSYICRWISEIPDVRKQSPDKSKLQAPPVNKMQ